MNKIIKVTDENGHTYSSTYVKRAKGLVKNNRAYWVDDKSICLKMPHKKMEVKKMNINDIDRMIALIQANNWAIKNSNNPNVYASASILAETYNEIVQELEDAEVHLPKSLSQIEYSIYENSANVQELIQMIYNKDCLIHPILKLEREKILSQNCNSNETKKENLKDVVQDFANQAVNFGKNISNKVMKNLNLDALKDFSENIDADILNADIENNTSGVLQMSIPYTKGWTAYVDGNKTETIVVNTAFIGIPLEKGKHQIKLEYETPYLKIGLICSSIGVIAFIILSISQKIINNKNGDKRGNK